MYFFMKNVLRHNLHSEYFHFFEELENIAVPGYEIIDWLSVIHTLTINHIDDAASKSLNDPFLDR